MLNLSGKGFFQACLLASTMGLVGCGGTVVVDSTPQEQAYTNPTVSVSQFVEALQFMDNNYDTYVEKFTDETIRSTFAGEDMWFLIYDGVYGEHMAISLNYLRALVYFAINPNNDSLAAEFRNVQDDDILDGFFDGDQFGGEDYEYADYDAITNSYWGRLSGFEYNDERLTSDIDAMVAMKEQNKVLRQAAGLSLHYKMDIKKAAHVVRLGYKAKAINAKGRMSAGDLNHLNKEVKALAGVSLAEFMTAEADKKGELLAKAEAELGLSAATIEQKLLPELFGIKLPK